MISRNGFVQVQKGSSSRQECLTNKLQRCRVSAHLYLRAPGLGNRRFISQYYVYSRPQPNITASRRSLQAPQAEYIFHAFSLSLSLAPLQGPRTAVDAPPPSHQLPALRLGLCGVESRRASRYQSRPPTPQPQHRHQSQPSRLSKALTKLRLQSCL